MKENDEKLKLIRTLVFKATLNSSKVDEWMFKENFELMGFSPQYIIDNGGIDLLIEYLKRKLALN
jgi:hypothetical protein